MTLASGTRLGPYEILAPLGAGGMGEVYKASDPRLGRDVAIKVLPAHMAADADHRRRFEQEAKAIAALNHPNIVTLHSIEDADGQTFLTMEFVEGKTLAQLIPPTRLRVGPLLALAIPLVDAVDAAHRKGITHRDLKPANVMVTTEGRVKVLDFGLAKLREEALVGQHATVAVPLTGEGHIVGTVAYMSPEQAEGRPVDHRSDLFSLGVILYEMATGPAAPEVLLSGLALTISCQISAEGQRLLHVRIAIEANLVHVALEPHSPTPIPITHGTWHLRYPDVSPDGRWVSATRHDQIVKFPIEGGEPVVLTKGENGSWSPDGTWI